MLITRRAAIAGAMATMAIQGAKVGAEGRDWKSLAVEDLVPPLLPPSLQSHAGEASLAGPITDYQPFGTQAPKTSEQKIASAVLAKVPAGTLPIDVALYFLDVAAGKYGEELRPYTTAWPVRWNPVIVHFFSATDTRPSGDTTAWCAAFVNFCLLKGAEGQSRPIGTAEPTLSAASRSFRTWSRQTDNPKPGDLVVFRNASSPGYGHVGFYLDQTPSSVLVLGGNQFEGQPVRHAINRKAILKDGKVLKLHSYRTDPQLHA